MLNTLVVLSCEMVGTLASPVTSEPFTYAFLPLMTVLALAASDAIVVSTTLVEPDTPNIVTPDLMFPETRFASAQVMLAADA